MHYKQLSAYSCVIWFVPLQCMSVQNLLCEKIKILVTNMQTDNSRSLNLWKFHENDINASLLLALPSFQQSSGNNADIGRV